MFDEISVEMRRTKRGNRLITKSTPVTLQASAASSSAAASAPAQRPLQAAEVPGPLDIPEYNEITFNDAELQPTRIGKVCIGSRRMQ